MSVKYKSLSKRASKRNAVMHRALAVRPTQESIRQEDKSCPLCGAPAENLVLECLPAARRTSYTLSWLGIACTRWIRQLKAVRCQNCEGEFVGPSVHRWNFSVSMRRFADFGLTKLPLPKRRRSRTQASLKEALQANLKPAKRHLVSLKLRKGLLSRPARTELREQAARWRTGDCA